MFCFRFNYFSWSDVSFEKEKGKKKKEKVINSLSVPCFKDKMFFFFSWKKKKRKGTA